MHVLSRTPARPRRRRLTTAARGLCLVASTVALSGVIVPGTATSAVAAEQCQVAVPARVVLRAVDEPFPFGARLGSCPAWVRESGYHSLEPPESRAVRWIFQRVSARPVDPSYSSAIWLTSFRGGTPGVSISSDEYFPPAPGTYRLNREWTASTADGVTPFHSNLGDVELTASNTFVARYWSGVRLAVSRSGRYTTISVVGRRDRIVVGAGTAPEAEAPASGSRVQLRRDGTLIGTLTLNRAGLARVTFADRPGRHTYVATIVGTPTNWPASALARR